uniref:Transcription factor 19 (SC1), like n=1 Tax=Cyprinus carpio TaxID=7962 RepID=A0A8C2HVR7_CYPCA
MLIPCFQLLRIGLSDTNNSNAHGNECSDSVRDLYTFRPALAQCVFRLGRAPELCDVTLESTIVSRIHAELHVERETDDSLCPSGTWVNEMRLQQGVLKEIFDGDTLTIGGQSGRASPEFYFLFQKVRVHPLDFDAITVPKAGSFSSDIKNRIRTCSDRKPDPGVDISKLSINRATVILNSIGSLSKMNGSCWTFKKSQKTSTLNTPVFSALAPPTTPPPFQAAGEISSKSVPPSSKSRRKSAHTVLLEDDSSDDPYLRKQLHQEMQLESVFTQGEIYTSILDRDVSKFILGGPKDSGNVCCPQMSPCFSLFWGKTNITFSVVKTKGTTLATSARANVYGGLSVQTAWVTGMCVKGSLRWRHILMKTKH